MHRELSCQPPNPLPGVLPFGGSHHPGGVIHAAVVAGVEQRVEGKLERATLGRLSPQPLCAVCGTAAPTGRGTHVYRCTAVQLLSGEPIHGCLILCAMVGTLYKKKGKLLMPI